MCAPKAFCSLCKVSNKHFVCCLQPNCPLCLNRLTFQNERPISQKGAGSYTRRNYTALSHLCCKQQFLQRHIACCKQNCQVLSATLAPGPTQFCFDDCLDFLLTTSLEATLKLTFALPEDFLGRFYSGDLFLRHNPSGCNLTEIGRRALRFCLRGSPFLMLKQRAYRTFLE